MSRREMYEYVSLVWMDSRAANDCRQPSGLIVDQRIADRSSFAGNPPGQPQALSLPMHRTQFSSFTVAHSDQATL